MSIQTNNIINLAKADPSKRFAGGPLMATLRMTAQKRLTALLSSLFDQVDDALFDMAERAGSNSNQACFFDGMREVRKKRQSAEALWQGLLTRLFNDFEAGKLAPTQEQMSSRQGSTEPLALVEDAVLEETLAIDAMIDRAEGKLSRPLHALNQRFCVIAEQRKVDSANNPVGPYLLCNGFADALREFEIDLQVKLIVLKLFERHIIGNLEALYDELNALMVQHQVLPDLRHTVPNQRPHSSGQQPEPAGEPHAGPTQEHQPRAVEQNAETAVSGTDGNIMQLVHELHRLLATRRAPQSEQASIAPAAPFSAHRHGLGHAPTSVTELLNALSLMQSELLHAHEPPYLTNAAPIGFDTDPRRIKQKLVQHVRHLAGSTSPQIPLGSDEDTIDLVGMLFEYALQDRNLPAPIQAQLARLQIPYLKVALLDKGFIAHKTHPARRLLDDMAQACMGWSEESDRDQRLYNKVQEIVSALLKDFVDDTGIFEKLALDFSDFIEKNRKRAELAEKRATEAARGKERLETAQRAAAHAILTRISGHRLPEAVRELLTRRWSNYMVLTYLRYGEDSHEWRSAIRFIDDFAWSVQPKKDEKERLRLSEMSPEIERLLKQGLSATGFHESHVNDLWKEVAALYDQQIAGAATTGDGPGPEATEGIKPPEGVTIRFASSRAGEEVVFSHAETQAESDPDTDYAATQALDTWLKMARTLKAGTWFEFIRDDGSRERAKLLWISTIKALYLFVNRNGLKIAEKTATELAEELKNQKAIILEQAALVDRALDAILHRLKDAGADPEHAAASDDPSGLPAT